MRVGSMGQAKEKVFREGGRNTAERERHSQRRGRWVGVSGGRGAAVVGEVLATGFGMVDWKCTGKE